MERLNGMFLVKLNNRGDGRIEAVLGLPTKARAEQLAKVLRYGRVRKQSVHVSMGDLPDFLARMGGPTELVAAAERLKGTIPQPGETTDRNYRDSAIAALAREYAEATRSPNRTGL